MTTTDTPRASAPAYLLPCAFCGCTKAPVRQGNGIGDFCLECSDCGASTRLREDGAGCEKDWNRRPVEQHEAAPADAWLAEAMRLADLHAYAGKAEDIAPNREALERHLRMRAQPEPPAADERAAQQNGYFVYDPEGNGFDLYDTDAARASSPNAAGAEGVKPPLPFEGWYVEVAANGERVLCIGDDYVSGLDEMEPFAPIVRTAAAHLLSFIGAGPDHVGGHVALAPAQAAEPVAIPQPVLDALRFYANGHHFSIDDDHQQFDTVSGEPQNWLCSERDDDCTMIEDGSIAKAALCGGLLGFEEPEKPLEGEVFVATPQPPAQAEAREGLTDELRAELEWCVADGNCGPRTRSAIQRVLAARPGQPEPRAEVTDDDKRDAARYRWMSRQAVATHSYDELSCRWEVDYVLRGESFDAAVDAARAGDA